MKYLSNSNHISKRAHVIYTSGSSSGYLALLTEGLTEHLGVAPKCSGKWDGNAPKTTDADTIIFVLGDSWTMFKSTLYNDSYIGSLAKEVIENKKPNQSIYIAFPDAYDEGERVHGIYKLTMDEIDGELRGQTDHNVRISPYIQLLVTKGVNGGRDRRLLLTK